MYNTNYSKSALQHCTRIKCAICECPNWQPPKHWKYLHEHYIVTAAILNYLQFPIAYPHYASFLTGNPRTFWGVPTSASSQWIMFWPPLYCPHHHGQWPSPACAYSGKDLSQWEKCKANHRHYCKQRRYSIELTKKRNVLFVFYSIFSLKSPMCPLTGIE